MLRTGKLKTCPICGRSNNTTWKLCVYCRTEKKKQAGKFSQGLIEFYRDVYRSRLPVSFLTGFPITNPDRSNFAHVLSKGRYPKFRLNINNVILVTSYEHFLIDHGNAHLREVYKQKNPSCNWEGLKELRERLLAEYSLLT